MPDTFAFASVDAHRRDGMGIARCCRKIAGVLKEEEGLSNRLQARAAY